MGSCICKTKAPDSATPSGRPDSPTGTTAMSEPFLTVPNRPRTMDTKTIDRLILQMVRYVGSFQDDGESPAPLLKINEIADSEEGWHNVVMALVRIIPLEDPLGPSVITIVFDDCPLPARSTIIGFTNSLNLEPKRCMESYSTMESVREERNLLVLLGAVAEKFAGQYSAEILTQPTLEYLVTFLMDEIEPSLVLHALITLEKFGSMAQNKANINYDFAGSFLHPLLSLEQHHDSASEDWRQVGFCARWALDNVFLIPGRLLSCETVENADIRAMLNSKDCTEYLKISADGLEVRCDSHSFESVRGTFQIDSGCWYYEVEIITAGVMQIGWATKATTFQNQDGYGVGDDSFSLAYDGCRRLLWHKAIAEQQSCVPSWLPGDVLGCLIDLDKKEAIFSLNGKPLPVCRNIFASASGGFYAAASFMAYQQCRFNFGLHWFRYPPSDRKYRSMNDCGQLTAEEKKIMPRSMILHEMNKDNHVIESPCEVCFDEEGTYRLDPCAHGSFCFRCVQMLTTCPICRSAVRRFYNVPL